MIHPRQTNFTDKPQDFPAYVVMRYTLKKLKVAVSIDPQTSMMYFMLFLYYNFVHFAIDTTTFERNNNNNNNNNNNVKRVLHDSQLPRSAVQTLTTARPACSIIVCF
jgi:hypothetical protein